jgi:hypothetical protein
MKNLNNTKLVEVFRNISPFNILLGLYPLLVVLVLFVFCSQPMFKPVGIHPDYQHDVVLMFVHDKSTEYSLYSHDNKIDPLFIVFRDGLVLISKNRNYPHHVEVIEENLPLNKNNVCNNSLEPFMLFRISQEELVCLMKSVDEMIPKDVMAIDKGTYHIDCSHYQLSSFWNEKVLLARVSWQLWNQDITPLQNEICLGCEDTLHNKEELQDKKILRKCSKIFTDIMQLYSNTKECFPAKICDYEPPKQNPTIFLTQEIEISTTQGITIKKKIPIPEMSRFYVLEKQKDASK